MIPDVLKKIFEYLDDRSEVIEIKSPKAFRNLKSCILVNREWCRNAVPILWKHPFHRYLKHRSNSLIHTLLLCLSYEELQDIFDNGCHLPISLFESIDKFQSSSQYFDYPSFVKSLDYFQLIKFVKSWCDDYMGGEGDNSEKYIVILLRAILNHFAKRSSGLSSLNIHSNGVDDDKCMLLLEPNIQKLIKPNVLKISNLDETTILTARKLGVLIESQKGLKILQLIRCKLPVNVLIPSVLKQRRTLKELNFRGVNFEGVHKLDILKNSRLEKLKIIDSYNLDSNLVQSLRNSLIGVDKLTGQFIGISKWPVNDELMLLCNVVWANQLEISNSSSLPPKSRSSLLVPDVLEEIFSSLAETEQSTYSEMLYSVEQWCLSLPKSKKKSKIVIPIMKVLLRLFLHNAGPLHSLKLSSLGESYNDEKFMILAEPPIVPLISSVKNLSLDGFDHNQNGLLTRLPDLCQNLECLSLRGWYSNKPYDDVPDDSAAISLERIIKAQKYLISLDLFDCKTYLDYIISALVSQSVSLRNVYFRFVDFDDCGPWDGLASCMNLKNLEFWFCEGITDKMIKPLLSSDLSDLEQ
ncbi:1973_t:CDS:2 [Entrophospora sp. SA101]|nr:1973_t:CDS:2 [Entrophospora sp. SA101]